MSFWKSVFRWLSGSNDEPTAPNTGKSDGASDAIRLPQPQARPSDDEIQGLPGSSTEKSTGSSQKGEISHVPAAKRENTQQPSPQEPVDNCTVREKPRTRVPESTQPQSRSLQRQARPNHKPVTIGFDFGTHSTKILVRQRGEQKAQVLRIDDATDGYPWFASPSLVRIADDSLFFGNSALQDRGGTLYRSLKVCLLPPSDHVSNLDFPPGPSPDVLVASYLSWALNRVKDALAAVGQQTVFLNLAAPMDHIEDEGLKSRYLQIVNAAWETVFGSDPISMDQGMPVSVLSDKIAPLLSREVPDSSERRFEILPETVAPIVSLSRDPRMPSGMYMIIDMGAGTTELSMNHVGKSGADQTVLCYVDESRLFGGDNFAWIDSSADDESYRSHQLRALMNGFRRAFNETWKKGYDKDQRSHAARNRWREVTLVLTGGGTKRTEIEKFVEDALPFPGYPVATTRYEKVRHQPVDVTCGANSKHKLGEESSFLAVAHGLCFERQRWPIVFEPGDIEQLEPTAVVESLPAFWYVGGK